MKRIITTIKKIIKKYFLVVLLVIVFVLSAITSSYGVYYTDVNNYEQDPSYLIKTFYDNQSVYFIKLLLNVKNQDEFANMMDDIATKRQFMFVQNISTSVWRLYYVNGQSTNTSEGLFNIDNSTQIPTVYYQHNCNYYYEIGWNNGYYLIRVDGNPYHSIQVPLAIDLYTNPSLFSYAEAYTKGDFFTQLEILFTIQNQLNYTNTLLNQIRNSLDTVNNNITNDNTTGISTDIISENPLQQGESEDFFNSVYSTIVNGLTRPYSKSLVIPFPFVDYIFSFNSMFLSDTLENFTDGVVPILDLIHLFWYFTIGIYIYKDIQKYKDEFRSGEVLKKTDTNIKTEML